MKITGGVYVMLDAINGTRTKRTEEVFVIVPVGSGVFQGTDA